MNPQAEKVNQVIAEANPVVLDLLSEKGKGIYFPYAGILGQSAAAKGKKYNATIGIACEDDKSPMRLKSLEKLSSLAPAKTFPYAPSFGSPDLRKQWKEMLVQKNPSLEGQSFSLPVVTQALTHGLSLAGFLFLDPGEELLVPDPYWDNYSLLFEEGLGAKVKTFPCFVDNAKFNSEGLKSVLSERKGQKVSLLLNFPNNPTGYTPLETEMEEIYQALLSAAEEGTKLVVLVDDAYFGLVYEDGVAKESIFAKLANCHENLLAVKIDGATKEDYVWGYRVGFISFGAKGLDEAAYKALADKAGGAIRGMISNCSQLSQSMILEAYQSDSYESEKKEKYEIMKNRYEILKKEIDQRKEFEEVFVPLPYNSGYFMCIQPKAGINAEEVRQLLLEKYETGLIALQGLLRIAFSSAPADHIPAILENVYQACKEVAKK